VNIRLVGEALHNESLVMSGQLDEAEASIPHTLETARRCESLSCAGMTLRTLALLRAAQERWGEARDVIEESIALLEKRDILIELGRALLVRASIHAHANDMEAAERDRARSEKIFSESGAALDLQRARTALQRS
jgi:uncharacterized protein YjbJ (UPF0337 family)